MSWDDYLEERVLKAYAYGRQDSLGAKDRQVPTFMFVREAEGASIGQLKGIFDRMAEEADAA